MAKPTKIQRTDPKKPKIAHQYKAAHKRGNKPNNDQDCNRTIPRAEKKDEIKADCECGAKGATFKYEKQIETNDSK